MVKGILAVVAGLVVVAGLLVFEPWRALTDRTVEESVPVSQAVAPPTLPAEGAASGVPAGELATPHGATPPTVSTLAEGDFETAEHRTTGAVRVIRLADGRRFVRLEGLDTSDGPDLHVWLSSAPSGGAWGSYDDGRHLALGELKANHGSHNYAVPADADLGGLRSVVIWCDRFDVAFGTAAVDLG